MCKIVKDTATFNMPWEKEYGYFQAIKTGNAITIYLSGQISHDSDGEIVGIGDMEAQMRQAYSNVGRVLARYGATMDDVIDETLFVTDIDAAYEAHSKLFKDVPMVVTSTIVEVRRLVFPQLMIELKCIAMVA